MTDNDMIRVPFRGSGKALLPLLSDHVDPSFENTPTVLSHYQSGKLKALAGNADRRNQSQLGLDANRAAMKSTKALIFGSGWRLDGHRMLSVRRSWI